ncbi:HAD family hydrolase [Streptomyces sp. NPDC059452]|uniref:HAD family hydrolase n=1 Tax=Streptomyces sp. NPDC059452 TaxID=3346835 RepID=UPI00369063ED
MPGAERLLELLTRHRAVVFDLDGVLVDSNELKAECMGEALSPLGAARVTPFLEEFRSTFGRSRREHFAAFHRDYLGRPDEGEEFERFYERYAGAYAALLRDRYPNAPLCAHADLLVKELVTRGIPLYVATGTLTGEARQVLHGHGLLDSFRDVLGGERPKWQRLGEILEHAGLPPSAAVLVGDSRQDLLAAHRAGTSFQLVTRYGFFGHDRVLTGAEAEGSRWAVDLRPDGPVSALVTDLSARVIDQKTPDGP